MNAVATETTSGVYERILWASEGRERLFAIKEACRELHHLTIDQGRRILTLCGSFDVARALRVLRGHMARRDWWALFGEEWTRADDGPHVLMELNRWLRSAPPDMLALAMGARERDALAAQPDTFTVWRGCYAHNAVGVSWSLSRDIAEKFTTRRRYHHPDKEPLLVQGIAKRDRCILKLDSKEQEIVTSWNDVEVADRNHLVHLWIGGAQ